MDTGRRPTRLRNYFFTNGDSFSYNRSHRQENLGPSFHFFATCLIQKAGNRMGDHKFLCYCSTKPHKLVSGIHIFLFLDPNLGYFCPFIFSSTNALIPTVYWLQIYGRLLRGDVVPFFLEEGYKSIPVLSFFTYSAQPPYVCPSI